MVKHPQTSEEGENESQRREEERERQRQREESAGQGPRARPGPSDSPDPHQAPSPVTAGSPTATPDKAAKELAQAIATLNREFSRDVPPAAMSSGGMVIEEEHRLASREVKVPDGKYRAAGGDWIYTIAGGKLKEVSRASPPDFGGEDVKTV